MPYKRKRTYKRKGRRSDAYLLKFRTGQYAPGGRMAKTFQPRSRVYDCVTAARYSVSSTTAGDEASLVLGNFNAPCELNTNTSYGGGDRGLHPSGHEELLQLGYDTAEVLSSYYRFVVQFVAADDIQNIKKDFVFAYKFSPVGGNSLAWTTALTPNAWQDMRMSRGWVYKSMSATQSGGSIFPSQAVINVEVPDMYQLVSKLHSNEVTARTRENFKTTISTGVATLPTLNGFLHIVTFVKSGTAFVAGDVVIDVTCYMKVRCTKEISAATMIDDGNTA